MAGKLVLPVEIDEGPAIEALLAAGRLAEPDAGSRPKVRTALQTIVDDFIARWTQPTRGLPGVDAPDYKSEIEPAANSEPRP